MSKNASPSRPSQVESGSYAASLVEGCWLVALAVVPVLYDPHAGVAFQPVKMAVLRALGILASAGLLCHFVPHWRELRSRFSWPLGAALLLLFSSMVSSVFSIVPASSWLGYGQSHQGTISLACAMSLFAGVALLLRTPEQFERFASAALAGSLPVALYAVVQAAGRDPISFNYMDLIGIGSLPGYSSYLAAYQLMVIPLCVWRIAGRDSFARAVPYWILLLLQIAAFLASQKRGAFLAGVAGFGAAAMMIAMLKNKPRMVRAVILSLAGIGVLLIALAGVRKAGVIDDSWPVVGRLASIVPIGGQTGDPFRSTLWKQAPSIVLSQKPFKYPEGSTDRISLLRPILGYGGETLAAVLPQSWSLGNISPNLSEESHFHTNIWDVLYAQGFFGLGAFLVLVSSIFFTVFERLGLVHGRRDRLLFMVWGVLCTLAGGVLLSVISGFGFAGLGAQFGLIAGLITFPLWRMEPLGGSVLGRDGLRAIILIFALVAYLVDIAFSFASAVTFCLFWILAGAATASEDAAETVQKKNSKFAAVFPGVLSGLILVALIHGFVDLRSLERVSVFEVLWNSPITDARSHGLFFFVVILPSWIGTTLLLCEHGADGWKGTAFALFLSAAIAGIYAVLKAWWIVSAGPVGLPVGEMPSQLWFFEFVGLPLIVAAVLAVIAMACGLAISLRQLPLVLVALVPAVFAIWWLSVRIVRAEDSAGWGRTLAGLEFYPQAALAYHRALQLEPGNAAMRIKYAETLLASDPGKGASQAVAVLDAASQEPSRVAASLGALLLQQALDGDDPAMRRAVALRAENALARALVFEPQDEMSWIRREFIARGILGDAESAARFRQAAEQASTGHKPHDWGSYYAEQSHSSPEPALSALYAEHALGYLDRALLEKNNAPEVRYELLLKKAMMHRVFGDQNKEAFEALVEAVKIGEKPWEARSILAEMAAEAGNRREAEVQIDLALKDTPEKAQPGLRKFKESLSALGE
jgi:hypothetical protein